MHDAAVTITTEMSDEELQLAQRLAWRLDQENIGTDDPPESYSASLALSRIIASNPNIVTLLMPYCREAGGYVAEPVRG